MSVKDPPVQQKSEGIKCAQELCIPRQTQDSREQAYQGQMRHHQGAPEMCGKDSALKRSVGEPRGQGHWEKTIKCELWLIMGPPQTHRLEVWATIISPFIFTSDRNRSTVIGRELSKASDKLCPTLSHIL